MSTPSTSPPNCASGSAVVPSPQARSSTFSPFVISSDFATASPLSLIVAAMRVKSPFSHNALFGFIDITSRVGPCGLRLVRENGHALHAPRRRRLARALGDEAVLHVVLHAS